LPLQSLRQQVPYESTLGGFAMFNSGATDLAPQLYGYYGEPGVNTATETTLILVGNHFSVNNTQVIAGNLPCLDRQLLSRRILRVTVPAGVQTMPKVQPNDPDEVDIHVVTSYGVSEHLRVPVVSGGILQAFSWKNQPERQPVPYTDDGKKPATIATADLGQLNTWLVISPVGNALVPPTTGARTGLNLTLTGLPAGPVQATVAMTVDGTGQFAVAKDDTTWQKARELFQAQIVAANLRVDDVVNGTVTVTIRAHLTVNDVPFAAVSPDIKLNFVKKQ
jgi:hypothetical protein